MFRLFLASAVAVGVWPGLSVVDAQTPPGPLTVDVADDLMLQAGAETRRVPYKVYFPTTGGPFPVIVFSHGFGGTKDVFAPVGKHWASHGYIVVHPTHADGLGREQAAQPAGDERRPARNRRDGLIAGLNDPARIAERVADIVLIIDSLAELPKAVPALATRVDAKRIGVGGHSFGAYTAMLIGGVTADLDGEQRKSLRDERVSCILTVSPQGAGQQGLTPKSWAGLTIPMMTITGTRDSGVGGQSPEWRKEPYEFSPPGHKYLVVIEGANHFSFGGRLGGRSSGITDAVNALSTHFWDAYLKDSKLSREYLHSDRPAQESGGSLAFKRK